MAHLVDRTLLNGDGNLEAEQLLEEAHTLLEEAHAEGLRLAREHGDVRRLARIVERQQHEATSLMGIALVGLMATGACLVAGGWWAAWLELGFIGWLILQLRRK